MHASAMDGSNTSCKRIMSSFVVQDAAEYKLMATTLVTLVAMTNVANGNTGHMILNVFLLQIFGSWLTDLSSNQQPQIVILIDWSNHTVTVCHCLLQVTIL